MRYYILNKTLNEIVINENPVYNTLLLNLDKVIKNQIDHTCSTNGNIKWQNKQIVPNDSKFVELDDCYLVSIGYFKELVKKANSESKNKLNQLEYLNNFIKEIKPKYLMTLFIRNKALEDLVGSDKNEFKIRNEIIENMAKLSDNIILKCSIEIVGSKVSNDLVVMEYKVNNIIVDNLDCYSSRTDTFISHKPNEANSLELYNVWSKMLFNQLNILYDPYIKLSNPKIPINLLDYHKSNDPHILTNKKYYVLLEN